MAWRATLGKLGLGTRIWRRAIWIVAVVGAFSATAAWAQRPSTTRHVPELGTYLDRVEISEPVRYRGLAVYPVLLERDVDLRGRWLGLDAAIARGVLVVTEKGGGSVPVIVVENRSRDEYVFVMAGEVTAGGRQTRTIRNDVVVAPGQRLDLGVYCVEAHRWEGGKEFSAGKALLPQSIQQELRRGADQSRVWAEVARNNAALKAENASGSLELALKSAPVQDRLIEVRRYITPKMPKGTMGFIFVSRGRALGAELFGSEQLAREYLPKLLDSYAVDCVVIPKAYGRDGVLPGGNRTAIDFFERVCRAGSHRTETPGSGSGIRTRSDGLLGDGVSLSGTLVHYGVQVSDRIVPLPEPRPHPPRIWPERD